MQDKYSEDECLSGLGSYRSRVGGSHVPASDGVTPLEAQTREDRI